MATAEIDKRIIKRENSACFLRFNLLDMKKGRFKFLLKRMSEYKSAFLILALVLNACQNLMALKTGAERLDQYLHLIENKKVALVVNQTSMLGNVHLVDTLKNLNIEIIGIFAPEHGFRGDHSAGEKVKSEIDPVTKIPVYSLYGNNKKPTKEQLANVDIVIFDIQDVGARFYTYISTLHYVMEACAEQNKTLIILDRPNPNGFYVDGPVLDTAFRSFVGMHPIPVVHGMTIGEYANMINGEKWLKNGVQCSIKIIKTEGYNHNYRYKLPVRPSPNLPSYESILLYPGLCFFEGTNYYSLGRGTDYPFEVVGKPGNKIGDYYFTPKSIPGVADNPPARNIECRGFILTEFAHTLEKSKAKLELRWLIEMYKSDEQKDKFFNSFFDKLAGSDSLRKQIISGLSEEQIRKSWQSRLDIFFVIRSKYLLYEDFSK